MNPNKLKFADITVPEGCQALATVAVEVVSDDKAHVVFQMTCDGLPNGEDHERIYASQPTDKALAQFEQGINAGTAIAGLACSECSCKPGTD